MSRIKISGYWIVVGAATAAGVVLSYFFGAGVDPSPYNRIRDVLLIGASALALRAPLSAAWRFGARHESGRKTEQYQRDPMARVGAAGQRDSGAVRLSRIAATASG